jgi:hypothetical protein
VPAEIAVQRVFQAQAAALEQLDPDDVADTTANQYATGTRLRLAPAADRGRGRIGGAPAHNRR